MIEHSVMIELEKSEFPRKAGIICCREFDHIGRGCKAVEMEAHLPRSNSMAIGGFYFEGDYACGFDKYKKLVIESAQAVIEDMQRVIEEMKEADNPYRSLEDGLPLFRDDPNS